MLRAMAQKEWLKLRKIWWIVLGLNIAVLGYLYLHLNHLFSVEHAEMIWYRAFEIGTLYYASVKYLMVITGVLLGLAQFVPEMIGHRFRLSLQLPIRENTLVLFSLLVGLVAVIAIGVLDGVCLYGILWIFFPAQGAMSGLLTAVPWFFAGFAAYLGTALVTLEPQLSRKMIYLVIVGGIVWIFFQGDSYESFNRAFPGSVLLCILFVPAVLLPAHRYRNRRVA